jgi:hypothetical protein
MFNIPETLDALLLRVRACAFFAAFFFFLSGPELERLWPDWKGFLSFSNRFFFSQEYLTERENLLENNPPNASYGTG